MFHPLAFCLAAAAACAAEPELKELGRVDPLSPAEALKQFRIRPGFHVELAAAEPLVMDPVAFAFDDQGRLFVVEMRDYSERRDEKLGRVRMLVDDDGDGRFDRSEVFADQLPWPTGICCWRGGVIVAATPDLIYLRDADGDGRAERREVLITGLGNTSARLNVQQLVNGLAWGPDLKFHAASGGNGGKIHFSSQPDRTLDVRGRDFSFDPSARLLFPENGGGQYGLSFDDAGRQFVCSNSRHIQQILYRESDKNPAAVFQLPSALADIAADGPAAEVFRISPDEPWRVVRTRWRVSGAVPGLVEGGGRVSGYFTAATGITIYRGDAFPADYRGDAFVADAGSNLIHRKKVDEESFPPVARRAADESKSEFLASPDNWFRPVFLANGPDGCLYVADMYREVIEHPWSLPDSIKSRLDLNRGNDRGRIYRIVPDGFVRPKPVRFEKMQGAALAGLLDHSNSWLSETAARILVERNDSSAVRTLRKWPALKTAPGRLWSFRLLRHFNEDRSSDWLAAFRDSDASVRREAVLSFPSSGRRDADCVSAWLSRADDPKPELRFDWALVSWKIEAPEKSAALQRLFFRDFSNSWIRAAVLQALGTNGVSFLESVDLNRSEWLGREGLDLWRSLASKSTALGWPAGPAVDRILAKNVPLALRLAGLSGIESQHEIPPATQPRVAATLDEARAALEQNDPLLRLESLRLLERHFNPAEVQNLARFLGRADESVEFQELVLQIILRRGTPASHAGVWKLWSSLTPRLQQSWFAGLSRSAGGSDEILTAIESGSVPARQISAADRQRLIRDPRQGDRARKIWGEPAPRTAALEKFKGAVERAGDAKKGREIFNQRCANCHQRGRLGQNVGPDLLSALSNGKEKLLASILDPNREVAPGYSAVEVRLKNGESVTGIVSREAGASLFLKQAGGREEEIPRSSIERLDHLEKSLMPEGLEEGLSVQDLADLLEFLILPD